MLQNAVAVVAAAAVVAVAVAVQSGIGHLRLALVHSSPSAHDAPGVDRLLQVEVLGQKYEQRVVAPLGAASWKLMQRFGGF